MCKFYVFERAGGEQFLRFCGGWCGVCGWRLSRQSWTCTLHGCSFENGQRHHSRQHGGLGAGGWGMRPPRELPHNHRTRGKSHLFPISPTPPTTTEVSWPFNGTRCIIFSMQHLDVYFSSSCIFFSFFRPWLFPNLPSTTQNLTFLYFHHCFWQQQQHHVYYQNFTRVCCGFRHRFGHYLLWR